MKLFLSILTTILLVMFNVDGQTLTNGNFSSFCQTGNAFQNNNCVQNWRNSHGTPSLSTSSLCGAGGGKAWMWSYGGQGEGIVANYNFQACEVYTITFRVRTDNKNVNDPNVTNNATINLEAANNVPQSTSWSFPTGVNSEEIFQNNMGPYLNNCTTVNVSYTPTSNFSQLWIYPFMSNGSTNGSQAEMLIDDITITRQGYSTWFSLAATSNFAGGVTVSTQASANPGFVYHWWDVYYAPGGSTSGNSGVPGNPVNCCNSTMATFNQGMFINEWYYIKHGIWNDCMSWRETRRRFRVQTFRTPGGEEKYMVEIEDVDFEPSAEYLAEMDKMARNMETDDSKGNKSSINIENPLMESFELYPNPAKNILNINLAEIVTSERQEVTIINTNGQLMMTQEIDDTGSLQLDISKLPVGVYLIKTIDQAGNELVKRFVKIQ